MKLNLSTKLLAGALVLAASGSVFANTNITNGAAGNGSLFLNVYDSTNGNSYVLDLSAGNASNKYQSFNGAAAQSTTLSDANWSTFKASVAAGDSVQYNIWAVDTKDSEEGALFTSNAALGTTGGKVGGTTNQQVRNNGTVDTYLNAVNGSDTASTQSLFVTPTGPNANSNANYGDNFKPASGFPASLADVGTALSFYKVTANPGANTGKAPVSTFAGKWNLVGDTLSYTVAAVPLPMPVTLLLSGLALMGIISRRKSAGTDVSFGAAA